MRYSTPIVRVIGLLAVLMLLSVAFGGTKPPAKRDRKSSRGLVASKTTIVVPFERDTILLDPVITFVGIDKRKPAASTRKGPRGARAGLRSCALSLDV